MNDQRIYGDRPDICGKILIHSMSVMFFCYTFRTERWVPRTGSSTRAGLAKTPWQDSEIR